MRTLRGSLRTGIATGSDVNFINRFDASARLAFLGWAVAGCASSAAASIYSCTDAAGRRLTSDRPILECAGREQRVLNADGSVNAVLAPTLTSDERADKEARERDAATERAARQDAVRRDRNLLARFPDEAAHHKAREAALDDVRKSVLVSTGRVAVFTAERKSLMDEAEFYTAKTMPGKLKALLDANDASTEAQRSLIQNQQAEIVRINTLYDGELARLRRLWAGVQPGSLVTLPASTPATKVFAPRR